MRQIEGLRLTDATHDPAADEAGAFEAELAAVAPAAFGLARRLGGRPDEAADTVQDACCQAWRYRRTRRGEFKPWFLAIVHRSARRRVAWITLPSAWQPSLAAGAASDPAAGFDPDLAEALAGLPRRQRLALWLRYGEDLSTADAAAVMGISDTALKQLAMRGREGLRARLAGAGEAWR